MTFALCVPHCSWLPERAATMARLRAQLDPVPAFYREFTDREPNWSWSGKLWQWGYDTGASHLLQLQDDVIVAPDFWPALHALVDAVPDQIIGLESVHPMSRALYELGHGWYTTADGLIGVGYVIPRRVLGEFLHWRLRRVRPGAIQAMSEDTLIDVFCLSTGRRVYHPLPTIIDHDVSLASTYGNDAHSHRRPIVTTVRGAETRGWRKVDDAPYVGRFYAMTPRLCRRWVKGFSFADYERTSR